jgi:hypothetical protein
MTPAAAIEIILSVAGAVPELASLFQQLLADLRADKVPGVTGEQRVALLLKYEADVDAENVAVQAAP